MGKPRIPFAALFIALLTLQGCLPAPCTEANVTEYLEKQLAIFEEWDAAWQGPRPTNYGAMVQFVAKLDSIRFKYNRLRPPRCLRRSHQLILKAMDKRMDAVDALRLGLSDEEVLRNADASDELLRAAEEAMQEEVTQFRQSLAE